MPQIVSCPDCGRKLRVPDNLLGKNVKCPGCSRKFLAEMVDEPGAAPSRRERGVSSRRDDPPPLPRDHDDRPPRRRHEDEDDDYPVDRGRDYGGPSRNEVQQGWERVRTGVNLVIIALWIAVGAVVTALVSGLVLAMLGASLFGSFFGLFNQGSPTQAGTSQAVGNAAGAGCALFVGYILLVSLLVLLGLACVALRATGLGFCMGIVPTRKTQGLKGLAIATFCLAIAGLVFPLLFSGAAFAFAESAFGGCSAVSGYVLFGFVGLAEFICFCLFLRGVALAMRQDDLAQHLLIFMIIVPVFILLWIGGMFLIPILLGAMFFSAAASNGGPGNAASAVGTFFVGFLVCDGLFFAAAIALFVWYLMLLYRVRGAIDGWLDR
jgi:hypothetical protein